MYVFLYYHHNILTYHVQFVLALTLADITIIRSYTLLLTTLHSYRASPYTVLSYLTLILFISNLI